MIQFRVKTVQFQVKSIIFCILSPLVLIVAESHIASSQRSHLRLSCHGRLSLDTKRSVSQLRSSALATTRTRSRTNTLCYCAETPRPYSFITQLVHFTTPGLQIIDFLFVKNTRSSHLEISLSKNSHTRDSCMLLQGPVWVVKGFRTLITVKLTSTESTDLSSLHQTMSIT